MKATLGFAGLAIIVLLVTGWFMNIYKVFAVDVSGTNTTNALIIRGVGVFVPPLGAIEGWMTFDSEKKQ